MKVSVFFLMFLVASLSEAQEFPRTASCTVEKLVNGLSEKIIEANNIQVTNANGGLRQNCQYTARDGKTTLRPIVADLQGGILVALSYDNRQLLLVGDQTPQIIQRSPETLPPYYKWTIFATIPGPVNTENELTVKCQMTSPDRTTIIGTFKCPPDSDFPTP